MFRLINPDDRDNVLTLQGAHGQSNPTKDVVGVLFQHYHTNTSNADSVAAIMGVQQSNTLTGGVVFKTHNGSGGLVERMRIAYDGAVEVRSNLRVDTFAPDTVLVSDGSNSLTSSTISTSELACLSGVTSNLQAQIDQKVGPISLFDSNIEFVGGYGIDVAEGHEGGVLNVGTQRAGTINIGGPSTTVNIAGSVSYVATTNTEITDANLVLNKGGSIGSAPGAGLNIEEDAVQDSGYARIASDNASWEFKAPGAAGVMRLVMPSGAQQVNVREDRMSKWVAEADAVYNLDSNVGLGTSNPGARLDIATGALRLGALAPSQVLVLDSNQHVTHSGVTITELASLEGISDNVQTQLQAKQNSNLGLAVASRVLVTDSNGDISTSSITTDQLNTLNNLTSNLVDALAAKQDAIVTSTSASLVTDATGKIVAGAASAAEVGFLVGLTSNVQGQLNAKQATITGAATTIATSDLASNMVLVSSASGKVATSASINVNELSYLSGVTSNVQGQLNTKQSTITGSASTVTTTLLTAARALVTDGSGFINVSPVSYGELNFLIGVDSNIQGQLSGKQATVTGAATTITANDLTASRALVANASGKVATSGITATELDTLGGITSNVQGQLNAKQAILTGAITSVTSSNLLPTRVVVTNATGKLAESTITTTELAYLSGIASNVQQQLDAKAPIITGAVTTVTTSNLDADRVVVTNSVGKLSQSAITVAELGMLSSVTSNVQGQLDAKELVITGAVTTVTSSNLEPERVVITDVAGKLSQSAITVAELGMLSGVASNVQAQLDAKEPVITGAVTTVTHNNLEAERVVVTNVEGKLAQSAITVANLDLLLGVTSNVQAQLDSKEPLIVGAATTITASNLDSQRVVVTDALGKLAQSALTVAELDMMLGINSNVQAQLDSKEALIVGAITTVTASDLQPERVVVTDALGKLTQSAITVAELDMLSGASSNVQAQLDTKEPVIVGAITTVTASNLDADRVVVTDALGKIAHSTITAVELDSLSGITSNVQAQLDTKIQFYVDLPGSLTFKSGFGIDSYSNGGTLALSVSDATVVNIAGKVPVLRVGELRHSNQGNTGALRIAPSGTAVVTLDTGSNDFTINESTLSKWNRAVGGSQVWVPSGHFVGLGTSNPLEALDVAAGGNLRLADWTPNQVLVTDSERRAITSAITLAELNQLSGITSNIQAQLDNKLNLNSTGPNTITTLSTYAGPNARLLGTEDDSATAPFYAWSNDADTGMYHVGANQIGWATNGTECMRLSSNGFLGLGITNPITPLEVQSGSLQSIGTVRYFNAFTGNAVAPATGFSNVVAITSHSSIWVKDGYSFVASSDTRIKKNVEPASNLLDLAKSIDVYRYGYVDDSDLPLGSQSNQVYGLLAQQVRSVLPEAVDLTTEFVPSIYKLAQTVSLVADGIALQLPSAHTLSAGARVKLFQEGMERTILTTISDVPSATELVLEPWADADISKRIFVYGHEVDDFHTLDKNKIAIVALGAVKELAAQVEALKAQLAV